MIYQLPQPDDRIDQGDIVEGVPVARVHEYDLAKPQSAVVGYDFFRVIVLTQTCDIEQKRVQELVVATVFDAQYLIDHNILKQSDIRGPLRSGRVWGWYFLPAHPLLNLPEMVVDFRRLATIRIDILLPIARAGGRKARFGVPYREHLAKYFGDNYSRIGLPIPYETL